jgi:hypothetical protein
VYASRGGHSTPGRWPGRSSFLRLAPDRAGRRRGGYSHWRWERCTLIRPKLDFDEPAGRQWRDGVKAVPAGNYKVAVTDNGQTGTYSLYLALTPLPDVFNVTLPVSISNGVPGPGAGNLETTSSEDDYVFSTSSAGGVQLDFSNCSSALQSVNWALTNTSSGSKIASGQGCGSQLLSGVAAGQYQLAVTHNGASGTYQLGISSQPPPQTFKVKLPASISKGVPSAGAGNLETTSSEDDYTFSTTKNANLQINFSSCSSSLSWVNWALINTKTNATVTSGQGCASQTVRYLAAGQYEVSVTHLGATGTYNLYLG